MPGTAAPAGTQVEQISMFFWPAEEMFAANVNVQRQVSGGMDEFVALTKAQFPLLAWTMISDKRTVIEGKPAWHLEYVGAFQGSQDHWEALAIEDSNHDIWLATCTALASLWEKYQPLCGQALQTFSGPK